MVAPAVLRNNFPALYHLLSHVVPSPAVDSTAFGGSLKLSFIPLQDHMESVLAVETSVVLISRTLSSLISNRCELQHKQLCFGLYISLGFIICPLILAKNTKAHVIESYHGSHPISYTTKFCLHMDIMERQCFFSLLFCKNGKSDLFFSSLVVLPVMEKERNYTEKKGHMRKEHNFLYRLFTCGHLHRL